MHFRREIFLVLTLFILHCICAPGTLDRSARDAKRREEFTRYEMEKELKFRELVENASSDEERKILVEKERKHHENIPQNMHDPLNTEQLKEVISIFFLFSRIQEPSILQHNWL